MGSGTLRWSALARGEIESATFIRHNRQAPALGDAMGGRRAAPVQAAAPHDGQGCGQADPVARRHIDGSAERARAAAQWQGTLRALICSAAAGCGGRAGQRRANHVARSVG